MEPWLEQFARANFRRSADTAHDLKTPLNVAVLNLELLRMRLRKLTGEDDEKVLGYTAALETELRRLGHIFDAFFLLSRPPDEEPAPVRIKSIVEDGADRAGFRVNVSERIQVRGHEARIRKAINLFFDGAAAVLAKATAEARATVEESRFVVVVSGKKSAESVETAKLFKFYYTDTDGTPNLSLATARLIAETYGGEMSAEDERDSLTVRLSLPTGDP
jgi:signal transduction histidine kinase